MSSHQTDRPQSRFLSRDECRAIANRTARMAVGGGITAVQIQSAWNGNLRWARNQVSTSGDVRNNEISVGRSINGAGAGMSLNMIDDIALEAAVRRAERIIPFQSVNLESHFPKIPRHEAHATPDIWSDVTYNLSATRRAEIMRQLTESVEHAGLRAAGYIDVSAQGRAVMDDESTSMYYPYTSAQYSITVRNPKGTGSGWAGIDYADWSKIDTDRISSIAIEKCIRSQNPVRIEPGRYTAILEPQAVCDFVQLLFDPGTLDRMRAENSISVYSGSNGDSRIGDRLFDERITVTTDCMNPELGFVPFASNGEIYYPATWVEAGVLRALSYSRRYGVENLGKNTGLPASGAFHMSGGTTSLEEMISTTKRGVLVTRFTNVTVLDEVSMLSAGYTRDGLWLIENGKISKPVWNFRFTESPMFALNNIEQLGVPQRVFHPSAPVVVPSLKVRDFSFTSLSDAI